MDMKTSPLAALNDATLLKTDALIDGRWVAGSSRFAVTDPATGQQLCEVREPRRRRRRDRDRCRQPGLAGVAREDRRRSAPRC